MTSIRKCEWCGKDFPLPLPVEKTNKVTRKYCIDCLCNHLDGIEERERGKKTETSSETSP